MTKEQEIRTRILIENRKVPQSQLYDVKAQLADDELVATEARNSLRLSFLDLMQLMELKGEEYFDVDSLDESIVSMESVTPEGIYASALSCMPQIKQAHYSLQSKVKSTKVVKSGYYPQLFLGAGINTGYYYSRRAMNPSFYQQFKKQYAEKHLFHIKHPSFLTASLRGIR